MSDFIAANLHKKVDQIMDIFFGAGVASHPTIIEQINYLLFMRALSTRDDELHALGVTNPSELVFDGELEKFHWDNLLTLNAEQLFVALEECFRKIPESTTNKTVRLVFRNAHVKLFDKPSLRTVLHEVDAFANLMDESEHEGKRDVFGDTYEYLLSKLAQAGTSGQFRTPRHIIEFIVSIVRPKKAETILDPAVGTAGFLVKAFEYLRREYTSPDQLASGGAFDVLNSSEHTFLYEHTFNGFDSDEDMIKFGMMNLYLHGLQNARMLRQNTLTDTAGSREKYDVVLANPPFSGKIDRESVAEELQMGTGATEVLFLRYIMRHLSENGRAGVIVPEGVLFNPSGAHQKIRKLLLENGLWCVVSLPSGVFQPYASVKTSILFFDKTRKAKAEVLFTRIEHDGFSLTSQRRPIAKNDVPDVLADIERYKNDGVAKKDGAHVVGYERIIKSNDNSLSGEQYRLTDVKISRDYEMVELGDILEYEQPTNYIVQSVNYDDAFDTPVLTAGKTFILGYTNEKEGIFTKVPVIIFDDFTTATKIVDFPFKVKSSAMKILRIKDESKANINYVYNALQLVKFKPVDHKRYWISEYSKLKIPLPPLDVQEKLVSGISRKQKVIEHVRELIAALRWEKQNFDPYHLARENGWEFVALGDVATVARGKSSSTKTIPGDYPLVLTAQARKTADHYDFDADAVLVPLISSTGHGKADIKTVHWQTGKFAAANLLAVIVPKPSIFIIEFLQLCLYAQKDNIAKSKMVGAANVSMKPGDLLDIKVPIPPIEAQMQIISMFEKEQHIIDINSDLLNTYNDKVHKIISSVWS